MGLWQEWSADDLPTGVHPRKTSGHDPSTARDPAAPSGAVDADCESEQVIGRVRPVSE
jgi:hypothetical protein